MATISDKNIITELEDLSIYNFDKCLGGNIRYLLNEYDKQDFEITQQLKEVWVKLYNEYCSITKNQNAINTYILACEINYIKNKLIHVPVLLDQTLKCFDKQDLKDVIKEISKWGFTIDGNKDLIIEVEKVANVLNNTKTKLLRKENEYKEITKKSEKALSIIQQKVKLHNILKIDVDLKKTNVLEWLAYWEEVEIISKQNKK